MKVCPLVTQAIVLEEEDKTLLVREADSDDLDMHPGEEEEKAEEQQHDAENDEEIFMNPEVDPSDPVIEAEYDFDIAKEGTAIRFIAKAYRGEVECLGELCRFHDRERRMCRFEALFAAGDSDKEVGDGSVDEIRSDIELRSFSKRNPPASNWANWKRSSISTESE